MAGASRWTGSITAKASYKETDFGGGNHSLEFQLSGRFEMTPAPRSTPYSFMGKLQSTAITIKYEGSGKEGSCTWSDKFEASGPTAETDLEVHLTTRAREWTTSVGIYRLKGNVTRTYQCGSNTTVLLYEDMEPTVVMSLDPQPYPSSAQNLNLTGTLRAPVNFGPPPSFFNVLTMTPFEYTLTLEPGGAEELELEVFSSQYERWRPSATRDGGAGEAIDLTATLKTKDGSAPKQKLEKVEWMLVDTSREPGVAINWPPRDGSTAPDLFFDEKAGISGAVAREVGDDGQRVVTTFLSGEGLTDALKVHPRDWGGWSTLRVTATLSSGQVMRGRYRGSNENDVRLPERDAGDFVARSWRRANGAQGASADDGEGTPAGDGNAGDGLTLYEEYRGFYMNGEHHDGDPRRKDYFAVNLAGGIGKGGLHLFRSITGLAVHSDLTRDELSAGRVVNHQYSAGPHRVDQHGVILETRDDFDGYAQSVSTVGRPSTPRDILYVGVPKVMPSRPTLSPARSYASATVAHELMHTVNVYHHGESDEDVWWTRDADGFLYEQKTQTDDNGVTAAAGNKTRIRVFTEQGVEVTDQARTGLRYLGSENGQHSGWENCVMRYDISKLYISRVNASDRIVTPPELAGVHSCDVTEGISVNAPNRSPQSRYGLASSGRGTCKSQLLVNDAVSPPRR